MFELWCLALLSWSVLSSLAFKGIVAASLFFYWCQQFPYTFFLRCKQPHLTLVLANDSPKQDSCLLTQNANKRAASMLYDRYEELREPGKAPDDTIALQESSRLAPFLSCLCFHHGHQHDPTALDCSSLLAMNGFHMTDPTLEMPLSNVATSAL